MIVVLAIIIFIILFFWVLRIFRNVLSIATLWYIKEYRFDRMWIYVKTEGISSLFFPRFRRPPLRPKAIILTASTLFLLGFLFVLLPFSTFFRLVIADVFTVPLMAVLVLFLNIPTAIYHTILIFLAGKKLGSHKPMIVVGVTGSIGKTTTKEYLATILSSQFCVLKTPESKNAVVGVAETILKRLKVEHEIFVVEMAAYKKQEIAQIARLVHPNIAIVTAINEQHMDLFGTLENTMEAKYELIEALKPRSIVVINADNAYTRQMAAKAKEDGKTVWMYTKEGTHSDVAQKEFVGSHIASTLDSLSFTFSVKHYKKEIRVHLSGEHQVSTLLASIAGAAACGMEIEDAVSAAKNIEPFRKTMQLVKGVHESMFIDDTFNNNPDAAKAALQFLSKGTHHKYLVFQPMIELGAYAEKAHKEVGELAGKICDEIILTNDMFSPFFIEGVQSSGFKKEVHRFAAPQAAKYLSSILEKDDLVLFKGKEAGRVLRLLM